MSPDAATRRAAAEAIFQSRDPESIELIDAALEQETDPAIAKLMREARAAAVLNSDAAGRGEGRRDRGDPATAAGATRFRS